MDTCDGCGTTVLFGGERDGDRLFCGEQCRDHQYLAEVADTVPDDRVDAEVARVRQGPCPRCGGSGPVEAHTSYSVWSAIAVTSSSSHHHVVCRSCGNRERLLDAGFSLLCGWWGFPNGLLVTPVQIARNLAGLFWRPDATKPSSRLRSQVRLGLAAAAVEAQARQDMRAA
jgi:hypothetical protein